MDVPAIVIEHLSKRYGSIRALDDLDLSVDCGEIFGFLGPNGAGKSTTIRLLLGYLRPTSGRAAILGLDTQRRHTEILRRVGYLPSHAAFEEVVSGLRALDDLAGVAGTTPSRRMEICEWVRLDEATLRRKVRDYSKGTRRKLGIVQALQHDPEVVIMDEPTEGLDPLVQRSFYDMLEHLRQEGKTIFFSSHIISEVQRVCDRVAIIRQGSLVTVEHISTLIGRSQ
jgi:ABC-2 type transport system ATP-binding protein